MKDFAALFTSLDQTTKITPKVAALAAYFRTAPEEDRLWTIALLSGRRPKRTVTTTRLREWAAERAGIPLWLFEEAYPVVGDLAETIALVLPPPTRTSTRSLTDWITTIRGLAARDEPDRRAEILAAWDSLPETERFVFNKLITGGFRMGVSAKLMTRALSQATDIPEPELAHRLMGDWTPETTSFQSLVLTRDPAADLSKPYPFYLAYGLEDPPDTLGPPADWQAEHKWDGIRGQLILRGGQHFVWSRGEELMTDRFPELAALRDFLPDGTVLDGELLAWDYNGAGDAPLPFNALQKRIGRKTVPKKLLSEAPVILRAYDLLEDGGTDLRDRPLSERRARLEALAAALPDTLPLRLSPTLTFDSWDALAQIRAKSREMGAEGIMLKRRASPYLAGRKKGDWWKWKVDPLTIDAVMIYAQAGHGRRANLFTDYTFAVWDGNELVPFTKAYSGLTDAEFRQITAWVRKNTLERFGPVRRVTPEHVFEIAFEGIQASPRHKSGVALRFPRMLRWRKDKPLQEANTLEDLKGMLEVYG
ncbi:DNA ligase [Dinoroseobacter shibae DFL 12 = DSM 16493]|uniref:DNA ligase (ATP) n=1 Tax=Dinoroseobacter shibae (strain DSM 16493 / NCIMB 14021 / DFL 12) TaxID=398580 RepID=A8LHY8_DINSH|nr:ATP-dependent DNA ligase [Dinoroseobacter shibae]ABV94322.1 DNA ligase [Dinoroseobacter shibae DFL 12 = DSM 16493]URF45754.1 ATP-dependent DNA ligase [Dinoroseobacter shibae]URF50059.1 ATP-dependent DNA ligase [Dinoroseobacter shibae]